MTEPRPPDRAAALAELTDLLQLEADALAAYAVAIAQLRRPEFREAVQSFREDHARHVRDLSAAVVVYRSDRHVINLFAWAAPGRADAPMRTEARQGFNVVTWRAGGLAFTAVSDVEPNRLMAFARDVAGNG